MLEIAKVSKLFNPGTVDEKTALVGANLTMKPAILLRLSEVTAQASQH